MTKVSYSKTVEEIIPIVEGMVLVEDDNIYNKHLIYSIYIEGKRYYNTFDLLDNTSVIAIGTRTNPGFDLPLTVKGLIESKYSEIDWSVIESVDMDPDDGVYTISSSHDSFKKLTVPRSKILDVIPGTVFFNTAPGGDAPVFHTSTLIRYKNTSSGEYFYSLMDLNRINNEYQHDDIRTYSNVYDAIAYLRSKNGDWCMKLPGDDKAYELVYIH